MRFEKNAEYDYLSYNITESNGYAIWYHWNTVKKHTQIIFCLLTALSFLLSAVFREARENLMDKKTFIFTLLGCVSVWLFIITPVHEILHLIPLAKWKLDNRCVVTVGKGTVSAMYNGFVTRKQYLICLVLPFLFFAVLLGTFALLTTGVLRMIFIILLLLSSYGSYTDIYMFFYSLKHIEKDDIIFGAYKKSKV